MLTRPSRASAHSLTVPGDPAIREETVNYEVAKCGKNRSCDSRSLHQRSTFTMEVPFSASGEVFRAGFAGDTNADLTGWFVGSDKRLPRVTTTGGPAVGGQ